MKRSLFLTTLALGLGLGLGMTLAPCLAQAQAKAPESEFEAEVWNLSRYHEKDNVFGLGFTRYDGDSTSGAFLTSDRKGMFKASISKGSGGELNFVAEFDGQQTPVRYPTNPPKPTPGARYTQVGCEFKTFMVGQGQGNIDIVLVYFHDLHADPAIERQCAKVKASYLQPDDGNLAKADAVLENLAWEAKSTAKLTDTMIEIPIDPKTIQKSATTCALKPSEMSAAIRAYFYAHAINDTSVLNLSEEKRKERFNRCYGRFEKTYLQGGTTAFDNLRGVDVPALLGPGNFVESSVLTDWVSKRDIQDQAIPVSCDMTEFKIRVKAQRQFFDDIRKSLAGQPLDGIALKSWALDSTCLSAFGVGTALGLASMHSVVVPTEDYDALCGDPGAQKIFAAEFTKGITACKMAGGAANLASVAGLAWKGLARLGILGAKQVAVEIGAETATRGLGLGAGGVAAEVVADTTGAAVRVGEEAAKDVAKVVFNDANLVEFDLERGLIRSQTLAEQAKKGYGVLAVGVIGAGILAVPKGSPKELEPPKPKPVMVDMSIFKLPTPPKPEPIHGGGGTVSKAPVAKAAPPKPADPAPKPEPKPAEPPKPEPKADIPEVKTTKPDEGAPVPAPPAPDAKGTNGNGQGIGDGKGNGLGQGEGGNMGGGVRNDGSPPKPPTCQKVEPEYSPSAKAARLQGVVTVSFVVRASGAVENIVVEKGLGLGLDEKAKEAISRYSCKPATQGGVPIDAKAHTTITFVIH